MDAEAEATSATSMFPKLGVKLSVFDDFIQQCGGVEALRGKTTTQVCDHVKLKTLAIKDSYCNMLAAENYATVAKATVFISHAWGSVFLEVVDALRNHFCDEPDVVVWFDLFSNSQHDTMTKPFEWWSGTFKSAIEELGRVVMVMAPWNQPLPLTRAWCLFELYCIAARSSSVTPGKFEVAMSGSEKIRFLDAILTNTLIELGTIFRIDCETSTCFKEDDRISIFAAVQASVGFASINKMVLEQLRKWIVHSVQEHLRTMPDEDQIPYKHVLGVIHYFQGNYSEAEQILVSNIDATKARAQGNDHPDNLAALSELGRLYKSQGKYDAAGVFFNLVIAHTKDFTDDNPAKLTAMNNLAQLYISLNQLDAAEKLIVQCVEQRSSSLGEDHRDTLTSMSDLAQLRKRQQKYADAENLLKFCLDKRRSVLGDNHIDTLVTMNDYIPLLKTLGRLEEAEQYICLEKKEVAVGDDHPSTLVTMNSLAHLRKKQGRSVEALELYESCLKKRRRVLGVDHHQTLWSMNNLTSMYQSLGRHDDALELAEVCLEKMSRALGSDHPDTLICMNDLAELYVVLNKYHDAELLFLPCLDKKRAIFGEDDKSVLRTKRKLADLYRSQDRNELAEALFDR
jgi:tetratricopeptide (TPR) repeat protein